MKKQQLSAVHRPLSLQTKRKGWFNNALNRIKKIIFKYRKKVNKQLSVVLCRRLVSRYTLTDGLVGKTVFYMLFNKVIFSRKLKIK